MLKKEQIEKLIGICEEHLGINLTQIRGNLQSAAHRYAAIWELLIIESIVTLGKVEYEPSRKGGSPDILFELDDHSKTWIECAYLYPREPMTKRKINSTSKWIWQLANSHGIDPKCFDIRYTGHNVTGAGNDFHLPDINQKKGFLSDNELTKLVDIISMYPSQSHSFTHSTYSFTIYYSPFPKQYLSCSYPAIESPETVSKHGVYKKIKSKAKQFKLEEPLIVWICGQDSPALSLFRAPNERSIRDVLNSAFNEHSSISAVFLTSIETKSEIFLPSFKHVADTQYFLNGNAKFPIAPLLLNKFKNINFNKWAFSAATPQLGTKTETAISTLSGPLRSRFTNMGIEVEIPAKIVIDSLRGVASLFDHYKSDSFGFGITAISDGWKVIDCQFVKGDYEKGEPDRIKFLFERPKSLGD